MKRTSRRYSLIIHYIDNLPNLSLNVVQHSMETCGTRHIMEQDTCGTRHTAGNLNVRSLSIQLYPHLFLKVVENQDCAFSHLGQDHKHVKLMSYLLVIQVQDPRGTSK